MADDSRVQLISAETADALIAAHDGDVALLCLYLSRYPKADDETAATALCRTRGEIAAAREKLERIIRKKTPVPPAEEPVDYDADKIVSTLSGKDFEPILSELTHILGTTPSRAYLNTMVDVYDHLGMPTDVILLLLNYCASEAHRLWGESRRPSAKFISEEAYRWANREIMTMELAEEYMSRHEKQLEDKERLKVMLGIRGRELSQSESKHIVQWLEMGFPDDVIYAAYDRTVLKCSALNWAYMNGILKKWHAAGLHELTQIEEAEGKRRSFSGETAPLPEADQKELERILAKLKGGKA